MKKLLYYILLMAMFVLLCLPAMAAKDPISMHEDNYFIVGGDDAKFHLSVEFNLWYPFDKFVMFAYTETAFWNVYNKSIPFGEYIHNPEVFLRIQDKYNILFDCPLYIFDYITFGFWEHKSNGRDGIYSRGMNTYYGEAESSLGKNYNLGARVKYVGYYGKSKRNTDITDYTGPGEAELFFRYRNDSKLTLFKLYAKGGGNADTSKGWVEAGIMSIIFTDKIQPKAYVSVFHGYGETLVDYNKKDTQIRGGLVFIVDE